MKRLFILLACIAMIMPAYSQVLIDGLYYNLNSSTRTAEVTYSSLSNNQNYVKGSLILPETINWNGGSYTVTSIGEYAFYDCTGLTSVEIPNSVTSIGEGAFWYCTGLTSVNISNLEAWCKIDFGNVYANPNLYAMNLRLNNEPITSLSIPPSITEIKIYTFFGCQSLTSVEIPNSVTSIGGSAFQGCTGLTRVEIPNSVTSIGDFAFEGCNGLTSVETPHSVTSIGEYSFQDCSGLTNFVIPNSVTSIGRNTFTGCSGLTSVEIPNSVTSIGYEAFAYCTGLTRVEIPNSVTSIGHLAFDSCTGLTSVEIPNSVTSIGEWAFFNCTSLTTINFNAENCKSCGTGNFPAFPSTVSIVNIGDNVKNIPDYAFYGCTGLTSVEIPNSVTSIGNYAFEYCSGLTSVVIGNSVTSIGSSAFYKCTGLTNVIIGNSVTSIGNYAFKDCSGLTSVEIPNSVTSIGSSAFSGCEFTEIVLESETPPNYYSAFSQYSKTATLTIPDTADFSAYFSSDWTNFLSILVNGEQIYLENDGVFEYRFIESLGEAYLVPANGYSNMTSVSIPDRVVGNRNGEESFYQVTGISANAFKDCNKLTQVKLPANCKVIGESAFNGCSGLTGVEIPKSVSSIGGNAFNGCSKLSRVDISNLEAWCNIDFKNATANPIYYAKNLCLNNDTITSLSIPASITEIKNYAFYNCESITGDILIPNSITSIGTDAFANIVAERCVIEDGVETLEFTGTNQINAKNLYFGRTVNGPLSFSGLESLEVSGFVDSVPSNWFNNNTALNSLIINPGSGIVIEEGAFTGCKNLSDITLPEDIAEIGANAFSGTAIKNLTVPNGMIGANAFANCNLDNIIIGAGVESIGEKAFDGSNAIKGVYATPTTPPAAENNTFSYYEAQLYVPQEAIDTYYNYTRCWYRFSGKPLVMPESIEVSGPTTIPGKAGETFQLSATISPSNVSLDRVLWNSTNPALASVDNNGLVTIHNMISEEEKTKVPTTVSCQIIASTLYENGPMAIVTINIDPEGTAIVYEIRDEFGGVGESADAPNDIYTMQGVCVKRNAVQSDIEALAPGIYIVAGKKIIVR